MDLVAIVWMGLLIAFLVVEAACPIHLVSIWFATGSLAALVVYWLHGPLWLQVLLYSLASALICRLQNPASVGFSELMDAVFPMIKGPFWYFTAYSALFFLLPLLFLLRTPRTGTLQVLSLLFQIFRFFDSGTFYLTIQYLFCLFGCRYPPHLPERMHIKR